MDSISEIEKKLNEKYASSNDKRLIPDLLIGILKQLDKIEQLIVSERGGLPSLENNKRFLRPRA